MKISCEVLNLSLRTKFKLSNSESETRQNVLIRIQDENGTEGLGEAALPPYYPENVASVINYVKDHEDFLSGPFESLQDLKALISKFPMGSPSAKSAIDVALYDLLGKKLNLPVWKLLNLSSDQVPESSLTIAIDTPELMATRAHESGAEILKIKLGSPRDLEIVRAVREKTKARLRLDVNGGWSREEAKRLMPELTQYQIELIEQPLASRDLDGFKWLKAFTKIPLFADESLQSEADLKALKEGADGVVIKIMKSSGITQSLKLIKLAREMKMSVMLSCMIESSLGVTAAAHLSSLADHIDLDGPLLISNDPFSGISYKDKTEITLPKGAGLGVKEINYSRVTNP